MFIIGDASTKHTGNYTCQASNPASTVTYTSLLQVDGMSFILDEKYLFYCYLIIFLIGQKCSMMSLQDDTKLFLFFSHFDCFDLVIYLCVLLNLENCMI